MDSLIQITKNTINGAEINSVNAREIYEYLGLAKGQFSRWIKTAIEKYDFIQNEDFLSIDTDVEGVKDYIVTLDMAKELCMVSNTDKGKETRRYFIEFEKQGKSLINQQSQEIQLLQGMLNTISKMDNRVTELEQTRRLENWQELALIEAKNKKVYSIAEKHDLSNDKEMIRKLHSRVWKCLKKRFNVPRYNEIPAIYFNEAKTTISNLSFKDLL
jgi:phage anti-repressor protein